MKGFRNVKIVIQVYLLVLVVFFLFRLALYSVNTQHFLEETDITSLSLKAFFMGLRFDLVIIGYIMLLPALILFLLDIFRLKGKWVKQFLFLWILVLCFISFAIAAADIPYFNHFFSRFSIGAFQWIENTDIVVNMVLQEPMYFMFFIPFIIISYVFYRILKRIFNLNHGAEHQSIPKNIGWSILFLGLMFLGVRGRIFQKSPIRIGTAYFSNNAFLNQLGLNPVFTLMRSYLDSKDKNNQRVNLMDEEEAFKQVKADLGLLKETNETNPSISRSNIVNDSFSLDQPNIILVIMESMSTAKMERYGNRNQLTPFLDSLSRNSMYFDQTFTAGKHTFNGIFSTLFSFPALYRQHPMKQIKQYKGMSQVLKKNGYSTNFFTTHDGQFDNVEGFLMANDFERVYSQKDYPPEEVKTTLGVPDDYLFRYSIPVIDALHNKQKPFFVTYMTVSDHGPYYIPLYFTPDNSHIKDKIVEYADWSLEQFMASAKSKPWYDNTIFVFIADHGAPITAPYDISLDYHHTPFIISSPLIDTSLQFNNITSQIDVFPTILGLMDISYENTTLGIDAINEERPYVVINDDDKIGVLDNEFFLIMKNKELYKLYKYRDNDKTNFASSLPDKVTEMEMYAKSQMQVFQTIIEK